MLYRLLKSSSYLGLCLFTSLFFREFTLAEIEHFVDPVDKSHPKFESVSSLEVTLYPSKNQIEGDPVLQITLGEAVKQVLEMPHSRYPAFPHPNNQTNHN